MRSRLDEIGHHAQGCKGWVVRDEAMRLGLLIAMAAVVLGGCARPVEKPAERPVLKAPAVTAPTLPTKAEVPDLPARGNDVTMEPLVLTFEGILPCADCSGIRTTLVLTRRGAGWAEGTYRLTETYVGRGGSFVTKGDWTTLRGSAADDDDTVYELNPDDAARARHFLRLGDDKALRTLNKDLKPTVKPDRLARVK
jgi:hypothetical protein